MSKRDLADLPLELDLQESIEAVARQNAHRAISQLKETVGVEAEIRISLGNVKDALLEAAGEFDADVLMIGRGVDTGPVGRLRDLTYAVVRDSPFPVLSV
jgi:nucleotide-binding universal stress UspA family protein